MATVSVRTVTVNAAFLREIKADNTALHRLRDSLMEFIDESVESETSESQQYVSRYLGLLDELRDQLAMHFALEEAYGYFEDAVAQAPRLSQRAEALRAEHKVLFLELCALVENAEQSAFEGGPVRRWLRRSMEDYRHFEHRLRQHEHGENELILCAFDDDIGVGD